MRPPVIRCALVMAAAIMVVADCGGESVTEAGTLGAAAPAVSLAAATLLRDTTSHGSAFSRPSSTELVSLARPAPRPPPKSAKRGVAYDLADPRDFKALSAGVSWWYNWSATPSPTAPAEYRSQYGMDFYPMIWGMDYDVGAIEDHLLAHPEIHYLLVMNEPNLVSQADLTPQQAASLWPDFEAIAARTGVKIVGPAVTWGTMPGYNDPVTWLDAFYAAYQAANDNRPPHIDYIALHWSDTGLGKQLDRLAKYGKPFWVTESVGERSQVDGAKVDGQTRQRTQMEDMVRTCESRADVFRYAWLTGRATDDSPVTSLLAASGQLTPLGELYLSLPYANR